MAGLSKITIERNQKILLELVAQPGNDICADCKVRNPRWASHNLGIFICVNCASIHRKIGTHITKVKSLTMDSWTKEQVEPMKLIGNIKSNAIYNPNEIKHPPPPNLMDAERDSELEQYIRSKYQFKRFIDKSALVASKLGPSMPYVPSNGGAPSPGSSRGQSAPLTSAVSSPSVSTMPPQIPTQRRSTLATAPAVPESQQNSQYLRHAQTQPQVMATPARKGVWDDLISLQGPSSSSSLPLQFQAPIHAPLSAGPLSTQGYQTSMPPGINPFQQQHLASNPYSQQQLSSTGLPSSSFSLGAQFSPAPNPSGPQQPYFPAQQPLASASAVQVPNNSSFFQPQPQQAMQIHAPNAGQALFTSENGLGGSGFMSAPATQSQFLSTSPAQYPSQSPQPVSSITPQPHMFSTTPQPQMFSNTPQPQQQQVMAQFMSTPSQQFQMQQQGGLGVSPLQSQPYGQMTMGQQPFFAGAGPSQQMGQFGGGFQQQPFSAGGFNTGGQQWGAM